MDWHTYFFAMALLVASKSKDRSTKVGCVIVDDAHEVRATGYNGFPRGFNDDNPTYHERPLKYDLTAHAEENAVSSAARKGVSLLGTTAYVTLPPCSRCARMLAQAGVARVNFLEPPEETFTAHEGRVSWCGEFASAQLIFREVGVEYSSHTFDAEIALEAFRR